MKVLVIGAGSMGRRRLRDLNYLNPGGVVLFEPDSSRCEQVSKAFGVPGYDNLDAAIEQRPAALVGSTPPAFHERYVRAGIEQGLDVFAEVPFVLDYKALTQLAASAGRRANQSVLAVSHTIRYYPPYKLIRE